MDAIIRLNEALQIMYAFVPKEIFLIILAGIVMLIWDKFRSKGKNENQNH